MAISKENMSAVKKGIEFANENNEFEFECVIKQYKDISKTQFSNVHNYLSHSSLFSLVDIENRNSLDITIMHTNYRISIIGSKDYSVFCQTNSFLEIQSLLLIQKGKVEAFENIKIPDMDIYFKMKSEKQVDNLSDVLPTLLNRRKYFRRKQRYSYLHTNNSFRVDLTVVKSSKTSGILIQETGVLNAPDHYEIEIEYLPQNDSKLSVNQKLDDLIEIIDFIKQELEGTSYLMTNSEKELLLCDYLKLIKPRMLSECNLDVRTFIRTDVLRSPRNYFLSYQPVTLEQENIVPPKLGTISILNDYSVTEKADGDRMLLYVDKNNNMYLIDSKLHIRKLGNKHKYTNSLLDGEFIKKGKIANELYNTYMIFDIYFMNGTDVRNNNLTKRIDFMNDFNKNNVGKSEINIKVKKHHYGDDIFKLSKNIYQSLKYDYHIDGLIFTPVNLFVGAYYNGELSENNTFGGTWHKVFKWKPPEENSIDMLTIFNDEKFITGVGRCVFADLKVAYNSSSDSQINPLTVLSHGKIFQKKSIEPKSFVNVCLPFKDTDNKPRTMQNEIIYNNSIVEYIFNSSDDTGLMSWKPYRVRYDKTAVYHTSKAIAGTANNYNTAMNVWRSILNPVTLDNITGKTTLTNGDIVSNNVYYARNVSRKQILSKPMNNFHNKIKENLFNLFKNKQYTLIDMASGKGGDIYKWINAGFSYVLGIDIVMDNLMNNNDGAYKRLYQANLTKKRKSDIIFIQKDVSESWDDINSIENDMMFDLYKLVSRYDKKKTHETQKMSVFKNIMNKKFDVVSCQFAIHYMFENEAKLNTFCKNVDIVLKQGGYFIGTCLDGRKVANILDSKEDGKKIGQFNENTLWMLEKKYDGVFTPNKTGQTISVYIESINQILDEYLVDLEYLQTKLAQYNIRVLSEKDLKSLDLKASIGNFELAYNTNEFPLPNVLKQYSFLNTWFVFKKY